MPETSIFVPITFLVASSFELKAKDTHPVSSLLYLLVPLNFMSSLAYSRDIYDEKCY